MNEVSLTLPFEEDTLSLGARFASRVEHVFLSRSEADLARPCIITLSGDIGTGKTTFIRAMLHALGVSSAVKSPTFSLIERYECDRFQVNHFDLYRVYDESELEYIGFRDYFGSHSICCIEWPEHVPSILKASDLHFHFFIEGNGRLLTIKNLSPLGETLLTYLAGEE